MNIPKLSAHLVFVSIVSTAAAQTPTNASTDAGSGEQVVQMSAFEVTTTQGHGYVATNADSGFKTVQPLLDIPQDIEVVTRDMLDDIGNADTSLVMQYFGTGQVSFLGESTSMRGLSTSYAYIDDTPENPSYGDDFFIDSIVIVRGEAQVLYLNVRPSGINLKYTKKPLPFRQTLLTAQADSWGGTRVVLDTTGPMGKFQDLQLGYRLVLMQQGPEHYFYNLHESHEGVNPSIQAMINNVTVRLTSVDIKNIHDPSGSCLLTPSGNLYTGAGTREANMPPNDMQLFETLRQNIDVECRATENWDFRFTASYWHQHVWAPILNVNNYNWASQTETWVCYLNNATLDYWTMLGDINGKYLLGPLSQQDNIGFGYADFLKHTYNPASPDFANPTTPFSSVAAINSIRIPGPAEFPPLGTPGAANANHLQTYVTDVYYQHTLDLIPRYLTAVVGWTWATTVNDNTANVSTVPYQASVIPAGKWIHRFGVVAHPLKQVSLYALTATGFAPPGGSAPLLYNGQFAPPQSYEGNEGGIKTNLFEGKISSTIAVFKISETNLLTTGAGLSTITGLGYVIPIGLGVGEGYDGDIQLSPIPNWQLVAYGYAGHWNDQNGRPIPSSYDNSWSVFTRYAFPVDTPLHGLAFGSGIRQSGGAHASTAGLLGYTFAAVPAGTTATIKIQKAFDCMVFATYAVNPHFTLRASCRNLTDNHYPIGFQGADLVDASPPRTFYLELDSKF